MWGVARRRDVLIKAGNVSIITNTLHHKTISFRKGYYASAVFSVVGMDWGEGSILDQLPSIGFPSPNFLPHGYRTGIHEFEYEEYRWHQRETAGQRASRIPLIIITITTITIIKYSVRSERVWMNLEWKPVVFLCSAHSRTLPRVQRRTCARQQDGILYLLDWEKGAWPCVRNATRETSINVSPVFKLTCSCKRG